MTAETHRRSGVSFPSQVFIHYKVVPKYSTLCEEAAICAGILRTLLA